MAVILGMAPYRTATYKSFWSKYTGSVEAMREAIAVLKASPHIDLASLEYARYQPILAPLEEWEALGSKFWARETGSARVDLIDQPNSQPLSNDEPNVVPKTRLALLDAGLRKCFNSEPPIPINATVDQKQKSDPDWAVHTVEISWEYGNGNDKPPTLFKYRMICPYTGPR